MNDIQHIKHLLQRFYDGTSTVEEEQRLCDYFCNADNVPEELKTDQKMFRHLSECNAKVMPSEDFKQRLLSALDTQIDSRSAHLQIGLSPNLYELQLLDMQSDVLEQQRKMSNQGYIPSLSLVGGTSWMAYTDKFKNYFHSHPSNKWYNYTTYHTTNDNAHCYDTICKHCCNNHCNPF